MKTFRNVLAIALLLCAVAALLTVSAWAAAELVIVPSSDTMYAGKEYILHVSDPVAEVSWFNYQPGPPIIEYTNEYDELGYKYYFRPTSAGSIYVRFENDAEHGGTGNIGEATFSINPVTTSANIVCLNDSSGVYVVGQYYQFGLDNGLPVSSWSASPVGISETGVFFSANPGEVTITATATNECGDTVTATKSISIIAPLQKVEVYPSDGSYNAVLGEVKQFYPVFTPGDASNKGITWYTDPNTVPISQDGWINANIEGPVKVIAVSKENPSIYGEAVITVSQKPVEYTLNLIESIQFRIGSESTITAIVSPAATAENKVEWVITKGGDCVELLPDKTGLNYAALKAKKAGTAELQASYGGITKKCIITVPEDTEELFISPTELTLTSGDQADIYAVIKNATASSGTIAWSTKSGDIEISTPYTPSGSSVRIKAKAGITKETKVTVTATIGVGKVREQTCEVTIKPVGAKTISLAVDGNNYSPKIGDIVKITAAVNNADGNERIHWSYDGNCFDPVDSEPSGKWVRLRAKKNADSTAVTAYLDEDHNIKNSVNFKIGGVVPGFKHVITYGNYATFDGANPLYFTTNELYSNFKGVTVDGYALTNGNQYYLSSKDGEHILVALNPAYLKLLSSANYHTIQIYSTVNQPATGYFRNYGTTQTIYGVRTGDDNNIALWVTLCVIGFAGAAGIVIAKRKDIFGKSK